MALTIRMDPSRNSSGEEIWRYRRKAQGRQSQGFVAVPGASIGLGNRPERVNKQLVAATLWVGGWG